MAERKTKRRVRCENKYVHDRLSSQKRSQVYHWLVPDQCDQETAAVTATHRYEEDITDRNFIHKLREPLGDKVDIKSYLLNDQGVPYNIKTISKGTNSTFKGARTWKHNIFKDISYLYGLTKIEIVLRSNTSYQSVEDLVDDLDGNELNNKLGYGDKLIFKFRENFFNPIAIAVGSDVDGKTIVVKAISADNNVGKLIERLASSGSEDFFGRNTSTYAVYVALKRMRGDEMPSFFEPKPLSYRPERTSSARPSAS